MTLRSIGFALLLMIAVQPAGAASSPPQDVAGSIARFVAAVNKGDQAAALAHFTPDVTIVEDIAPFRWQGPNAGANWMRAMWENSQRTGMTDIVMEAGPPMRVEVEGDRAYAVVPGVLKLAGKGPPLRSEGLLTFSLRKGAQAWLISAFAWSGQPIEPAPANQP